MSRSVREFAAVAAASVCLLLHAQPAATPARWLDPDRSAPPGTRYETFVSRLAGGDVSYLVYLPPDYRTTERRYPVIYWLHGLGGTQRSGARFVAQLDGAIRNGRAPSAIAVLVNGMRDSMYCDSADGKRPVESVIAEELIPHIDGQYRTLVRREARAVEGYSMGGFGAAHLAFKYPDLFGAVGIMAGALHDAESIRSRRPQIFRSIFGDRADLFQANEPSTLIGKNAGSIRGRTVIRIAVGDRDPLQTRSQALHETLQMLEIEHEYEVVPGVAHNAALFYEALGDRAFRYLQRSMSGPLRRPAPGSMFQVTSAPSRVLKRGDLELLTYESEEDVQRLETLYSETRRTVPAPGTLTTLYFRSRTDGSVQPYAVRLPVGYDAGRKYPLLVQLHGLNFKEILSGQRLKYRGMRPEDWIEPTLPVIYVHCYGRPSTFYIGMGEEDVLEVMDEVKRRFAVNPDHVFIMGHSMGGAGSYTVGLHYPDLFGGIMPNDAAMGGNLSVPNDLPAWMQPQASLYTVPKLYPNARNLDVFFKNAGAGIQGRSTEHSDGIVAQGGFATSESFPGVPHNMASAFPYGAFVPELIQHPIRRRPAEIKFYTTTLRYNRAYWITIDRLTRHSADSFLYASCEDGKLTGPGPSAIRISTTNLDALTIRLSDAPVRRNGPVTLSVDGQTVLSGPLPDVLRVSKVDGSWKSGAPQTSGAFKRHGLQGPIGDAFNSRFLAVYGDSDREFAIAELDAIRNPPGPLTIHGEFPMKAASKVTREDIASSNLILFGTPETNPVLNRMAAALPADLIKSDESGARPVFIYPNPENPSRYVVVWSAPILSSPSHGIRAGWIMPLNLLPDYMWVKNSRVVFAGHFDSDWRLADSRGAGR